MADRPETAYTLWFDEYQDEHRELVGGKNASLGVMLRAGLPVPPGFALTTAAYETALSQSGLRATINDALDQADPRDPEGTQHISTRVRALVEAVRLPADIDQAIRDCYAALCAYCDTDDVPVAVRSSATAEDLPAASFAGQQDTYLWIRGGDSVAENVKRCWSSLFTDRAIAYRQRIGYDHDAIAMSVGIQKMVEPKASGVAFTLNPADGDPSQIAIDGSWGLGEPVVSGTVTPDNFMIDKVLFEIVSRTISPKMVECRVTADGVETVDVPAERQTVPCLTDAEVAAVARIARRAEKHYGRPQDIEWAVDHRLPEGDNAVLLQSRPETVWSNRPSRRIGSGGSTPLESIVSRLVAPVHAKKTGVERVD